MVCRSRRQLSSVYTKGLLQVLEFSSQGGARRLTFLASQLTAQAVSPVFIETDRQGG